MKILLLNGPAGSGKDEVASFIKSEWPQLVSKKFAAPIRESLINLLGLPNEDTLERIKRSDPRIRQYMIKWSEELVKPIFGYEFFADQCAFSVVQSNSKQIVITDCGFQYEVDAFIKRVKLMTPKDRALSFELWRIMRPGYSYAGDSRSSIFLPEGVCRTVEIHNSGTLDQLKQMTSIHAHHFFSAGV